MNTPTPRLEHSGYALLAPRRASEPGYAGLDIWLSDQPSGLHFDPAQAAIYAAGTHGIDFLCIENPWAGENHLQAVAGPLDLIDHKGHHIEGFCFGGSLTLLRQGQETKIELRSPAPILVNLGAQTVRLARTAATLMEEFSILLAQRQAYWEREPGMYEQRLAAVDPLKLYAACLSAAQQRLRALPAIGDEAHTAALHTIHLEIDATAELISGFELELSDLL